MASSELQNKVVWITGASSGLGKALVTECASKGAVLVLSARRVEELEKVRLSLPNPEPKIIANSGVALILLLIKSAVSLIFANIIQNDLVKLFLFVDINIDWPIINQFPKVIKSFQPYIILFSRQN